MLEELNILLNFFLILNLDKSLIEERSEILEIRWMVENLNGKVLSGQNSLILEFFLGWDFFFHNGNKLKTYLGFYL
jgi:hypothetical protein